MILLLLAGCGQNLQKQSPIAKFAIDNGLASLFYRYKDFDCTSPMNPEDLPRGEKDRTHSLQINDVDMRVINLSECGLTVDRIITGLTASGIMLKGDKYSSPKDCPDVSFSEDELRDFQAEKDWTYTFSGGVLKITDHNSACTAYIKQ